METERTKSSPKKHTGSCHCGVVRYEVELDLSTGGSRCNCTACTKVAQTGALAKPSAFKLLAGEADLSVYVWGAKISKRFFCKHCGIHVYAFGHLEQLGGDYVSINLNSLDDVDVGELKVGYWDGRHDNWMVGTRPSPWPVFAKAVANAAPAHS